MQLEGAKSIVIGVFVIIITTGMILAFNAMERQTEEAGLGGPRGVSLVFHAVYALFLLVGLAMIVGGYLRLRAGRDSWRDTGVYPAESPPPWQRPP
jgi:hypothetical protein